MSVACTKCGALTVEKCTCLWKMPTFYLPTAPTLRDQFAMAALTGLATRMAPSPGYYDKVARDAFRFADAMMKAREEKI